MSFEYSTSDLKENEDPHTLQDYGFLQIFEFFFFLSLITNSITRKVNTCTAAVGCG